MSEEKLNDIQELIERKILLSEVSGGLTSSDKKFIDLWNCTIELQQENQKLTHIIEELEEYCLEEQIPDDYPEYNDLIEIKNMVYEDVLDKLKQLQEEE